MDNHVAFSVKILEFKTIIEVAVLKGIPFCLILSQTEVIIKDEFLLSLSGRG